MPKKKTLEELEAEEQRRKQQLERVRQEIRKERKKATAEKRKLETKRKCEGAEVIEHYVGRHLNHDEFRHLAQIARYVWTMPDGSHRLEGGATTFNSGKDVHKRLVEWVVDATKAAELDYQAMRAREEDEGAAQTNPEPSAGEEAKGAAQANPESSAGEEARE